MIQYFQQKRKGEEQMETVRQVMERAVRDRVFPYGEWAVFDRGGLVEEGSTENTCGRWFDFASLTKVYTATAVLAVARAQGLPLEADAAGLLGLEGGTLGRRLSSMTLRALLTHTAGLPAWYPFYTDGRPFFAVLEALLAETAPCEGMVYSDIGFMLLREILCRRTGLPFEQVIARFVSGPLGIEDLAFCPSPALPLVPSCRDNAVEEQMCRARGLSFAGFRPHGRDVLGQANDGNAWYYFHGVSGHAGLFGTCRAAAQLGTFYLNTQEPLLCAALTPQPGCAGRCLGFHTGTPFPTGCGHTGCGHTGFTGTSLWVDRQRGFGMAVMTNRLCFDHLPTADMKAFRGAVHDALLHARGQDHFESEETGTCCSSTNCRRNSETR